jgi:RNA polymerase sigma-70 factor (ECF subfamily)
VNDPNTAQDVVQDVFLKLLRGWQDGAKPAPQLTGWLYRVTHNLAVDYIRHESRLRVLHRSHADEQPPSQAAHQHEELQQRDTMKLALLHLRKLEPDEQRVVILRLQEGLSYRQIGEITKQSEGNVGFILHNAVKKMTQSLARAGVLEGGAR